MLETQAVASKLSPKPQTGALHVLLTNCVEEFYGSEEKMQKQSTEYVTVKMLMERMDKFEGLLKDLKPDNVCKHYDPRD